MCEMLAQVIGMIHLLNNIHEFVVILIVVLILKLSCVICCRIILFLEF